MFWNNTNSSQELLEVITIEFHHFQYHSIGLFLVLKPLCYAIISMVETIIKLKEAE